ncbi:MAG: 6,7-dimethyl-8-ribityllumazine synthase [Myxococcales bacterium]|nr:6,7-dimethyl-8-ribityllumazine synthase [Myxococcales bacterium]
MTLYEGRYVAPSDARFAIVAARFNHFVVDRLVEGALDGLHRHGVEAARVDLAKVPGAWELPLIVDRLARSQKYAAVIALGAVIRGSTPHFDYVAGQAASGAAAAMAASGVPVVFGVLTTDTIEQAVERAGTKAGNKGWEAALTAIEMVDLLAQLGDAKI